MPVIEILQPTLCILYVTLPFPAKFIPPLLSPVCLAYLSSVCVATIRSRFVQHSLLPMEDGGVAQTTPRPHCSWKPFRLCLDLLKLGTQIVNISRISAWPVYLCLLCRNKWVKYPPSFPSISIAALACYSLVSLSIVLLYSTNAKLKSHFSLQYAALHTSLRYIGIMWTPEACACHASICMNMSWARSASRTLASQPGFSVFRGEFVFRFTAPPCELSSRVRTLIWPGPTSHHGFAHAGPKSHSRYRSGWACQAHSCECQL